MSRGRAGEKQATGRPAQGRPVRTGLWVTAAVGAVIVAVVTYGLLSTGLVGRGATHDTRAQLAPDVTLGTAAGQVRLSDLRGQPLLLYFSFPG